MDLEKNLEGGGVKSFSGEELFVITDYIFQMDLKKVLNSMGGGLPLGHRHRKTIVGT